MVQEGPERGGAVRSLDAVFEYATVLIADASVLMRRARGIRRELEHAQATGADEAERLTCRRRDRGIEGGLVQGARGGAAGVQGSAGGGRRRRATWLRRLLDTGLALAREWSPTTHG
jgi:hypothetical protein